MSNKNNVNPDHYKVAGRDRPNEVLPPGNDGDPKIGNKAGRGKGRPAENFIPGGAPVGESPKADADDDAKDAR
ncbi:MAG TPA: hypothetical protein VEA38_15655 [Terriglobales bacterium]|nr:hypothetical protein [Terriglobales bacterium]